MRERDFADEMLDNDDDELYIRLKQRTKEEFVEKRDRIAQSRKNIKKGNKHDYAGS